MDIECKFIAGMNSRGMIMNRYHCKVTKAAISKPNVDIVRFRGKHEPGKSNEDVTNVRFDDMQVEYFPKSLQNIFPNMSYLTIEFCGLKEISREDLIGLEKLEGLNLQGNQLKSLPDDLFSNMPNLKEVWLSNNKIELASSKLIEPIAGNQLELFTLNFNTSIDEYYTTSLTLIFGDGCGCKTIQELMAKIDEKCKPPKPQMISKTAQCGSNCSDNAERQFLRGFNEFRLLGRFTDFVIVVGSKEFPVHKNVLATQSPILSEMFEVLTNGRFASQLEISDVSAEAVEAFLDYFYDRKLPDSRNAVEIFKLASKYEVAQLKTICEGIIHENLDESNAFEIIKLATGPHKSEELKVAAFEKLQERFGGELEDDLINDPHELQEIVRAKRHLDDLMNKSRSKRQRLV